MADSYDINLDDKFGSLQLTSLRRSGPTSRGSTRRSPPVNDSVVRLGIVEGEFHWHKHDTEDEFFLVIEGQLLIDIEDAETVTLDPHQGYTVPHGVVHRTRAPRRTAILMASPRVSIRPATTDPRPP